MGPPGAKGDSDVGNSLARLIRREEFIGGVSGLSRNLPAVDVWSPKLVSQDWTIWRQCLERLSYNEAVKVVPNPMSL